MQTYQDNDNKFVLLRKLLENQVEVAGVSGVADAAIQAAISGLQATINSILSQVRPSLAGMTTGPDIVVAVAGTAVQGPNIVCNRGALVVARQDNQGLVYVGGPNVSKGDGSNKGIILSMLGMPSFMMPVSNADQIFVNGDYANDSVGLIIL